MNNGIKVLVSALLISSVSLSAFAKSEDEISRTFEVSKGDSFKIENINGPVEIEAWDQEQITVEALITAGSDAELERVTVVMKQRGGDVSVKTEYEDESSWGNHNNNSSVEYKVMVPAYIDLDGVELVNGSLRIDGVMGDIKAELVNGKAKIVGAAGNAELATVNGKLVLVYADDAKDISRIIMESVNGSVSLTVPRDFSAEIDVETVHGSIKNDFGLEVEEGRFVGSDLEGTIGSGDTRVDIETVNGSVTIKKS